MLKEGDKAPDFEAKIQSGETVRLSDYAGQRLVLYFYPKDNTPTCTVEACNIRDNYSRFIDGGYAVLGVSSDSGKKHENFIKKHELPFDLITDPDQELHNKYGTWVEKKMYGKTYMGTARVTFVINGKGFIERIIEKVKAKEHSEQILN